jgi:hypothetical protein
MKWIGEERVLFTNEERGAGQGCAEPHSGLMTEQEAPVCSKVQGKRLVSQYLQGVLTSKLWISWDTQYLTLHDLSGPVRF